MVVVGQEWHFNKNNPLLGDAFGNYDLFEQNNPKKEKIIQLIILEV